MIHKTIGDEHHNNRKSQKHYCNEKVHCPAFYGSASLGVKLVKQILILMYRRFNSLLPIRDKVDILILFGVIVKRKKLNNSS